MSIANSNISLDTCVYSIDVKLDSSFPGFSCISIVLAEDRDGNGDLPIPRFSSSYITDQEQAGRQFIIGMPNFLMGCKTHIPPNGGIVTDFGKRMDVLYIHTGNNDEWQFDVLFQAKARIEKRLDALITKLDATYKRSPYANFQLTKR